MQDFVYVHITVVMRVICMLVKRRFRFVKSKDLIIYVLYVLFRNCLKELLKSEMKESLWNEFVYDSSVDYGLFSKRNILNVHDFLRKKVIPHDFWTAVKWNAIKHKHNL